MIFSLLSGPKYWKQTGIEDEPGTAGIPVDDVGVEPSSVYLMPAVSTHI
jgi:hypothetical protein